MPGWSEHIAARSGRLWAAWCWSEAVGAVRELTQQAGAPLWRAYSSIIRTQTSTGISRCPDRIRGDPGHSYWRYLASRVFVAPTGNGAINRPAGLGCVTYFVTYQL